MLGGLGWRKMKEIIGSAYVSDADFSELTKPVGAWIFGDR
jgi:hypothetical protein